MNAKKKPAFKRYLSHRLKKLGDSWRKPRGKPSMPRIGYSSDRKTRFQINGLYPVIIQNIHDLASLNPQTEIAILGSSVGKKKRMEIVEAATKKNITIMNLKDPKAFMEKVKKEIDERKKVLTEKTKKKEAARKKAEEKKEEPKKEGEKEELTDKLEEDKQKALHIQGDKA